MNSNLDDLFGEVWRRLEEGARMIPPETPGYRTLFHLPTVVTASQTGPQGRVVVLRRAEPEEAVLAFHTDCRADKVRDLEGDPRIGFCFYDPKWKLQVRAQGIATIHRLDEIARVAWEKADLLSRRCYLGDLGPGSEITEWDSGIPSHLQDREPTEEETEGGMDNFAVVRCRIHELELMRLSFVGHTKARWRREGDGWRGCWLTP